MQTIKFYTVGCKVNQYETQLIREQFIRAGFKENDNGLFADIYLINTCTVTHKADRNSRRLIHFARRQNPKCQIIVTGCYTELNSHEITKIPGVTHIIKNKDKDRIIELFSQCLTACQTGRKQRVQEHNKTGITGFTGHARVFLKIQDGCNNFCAYCKVPLVRGAARSRPLDEIIKEAQQLVDNGFKEIVLCGICLGAYGKDLTEKLDLVDVISDLEKIDGLLRIRLSSIEAGDVSTRLIKKMAESNLASRQTGKLCRHLHIPIQSGDDEILKKMNRGYSRANYLNLINKIKKTIPQIAITTDVLIGFPGENETNFKNTIDLIKKIIPLKVHIFPYSPRQGTSAYNFRDRESPAEIRKRILILQGIAGNCALSYKRRFLNKNMDVLIEAQTKENPCFWQGYTENYIKVRVKSGQDLKNRLIRLRLKKIIEDGISAIT